MIERLLMKVRARHAISEAEELAIRNAVSEYRTYKADQTFIRRGERLDHSTMLLDGLMCRYKDLRSGKRQITELHVAGDFADLHSFPLKRLDHDIMTLTACQVALVPHLHISKIIARFPRLGRIFWFLTALDAAVHREWELSLGQRNGIARVAHLFCELHARLRIIQLAEDQAFALGLTQTDLGESTGMTVVHVNRCLKELRTQGLVTFQSGKVAIHDLPALKRLAEFDPAYLYLDGPYEID
jgi:CRP-like cAMP-binding protein